MQFRPKEGLPMKIILKDISARHILAFLIGIAAIVTALKNDAVLSLIRVFLK